MLTHANLKSAPGSRKKGFRLGRGRSSGSGKTSGRGQTGQNSRTGSGVRPGFEGGQMPLIRRTPKIGFKYAFRIKWEIVPVSELSRFADNSEITPALLKEQGLVKDERSSIKILGDGELDKKLTVKAQGFSQSARQKIEKAGGKVEVLQHG